MALNPCLSRCSRSLALTSLDRCRRHSGHDHRQSPRAEWHSPVTADCRFRRRGSRRCCWRRPVRPGSCVRFAPVWVHRGRILATTNLKLGNGRPHRVCHLRAAPSLNQDFAVGVNHAGEGMRHHNARIGQQTAPVAGMMPPSCTSSRMVKLNTPRDPMKMVACRDGCADRPRR